MKFKFLLITFIFFTGCDFFKSANSLYQMAESKRDNKKPKEAIVLLSKLIKKYKNDNLAIDSQYLIAEIYYRDMQDFTKAIEEYDKVQTDFRGSDKTPFSIFMQGYIYANALLNYEKARVKYELFIEKYSNHELLNSVEFELKYLGLDIKEIPELKHLIK